jgi:calcium/calmodulin-dependent protein kinase I
MGLFKALDSIVHGGVGQPESYEKKKNYTFADVLGNFTSNKIKAVMRHAD